MRRDGFFQTLREAALWRLFQAETQSLYNINLGICKVIPILCDAQAVPVLIQRIQILPVTALKIFQRRAERRAASLLIWQTGVSSGVKTVNVPSLFATLQGESHLGVAKRGFHRLK